MKTLKGLGDLSNLRDLRSIARSRKSSKPQLPTTAILELRMAVNERDHLVKERMKLLKRRKQIDNRLLEITKDMDVLQRNAIKMVRSVRNEVDMPEEMEKAKFGRTKVILDY
ncbi:MAG: hypothetical protein AAB893_04035 [Patescibacteria group bacterium]